MERGRVLQSGELLVPGRVQEVGVPIMTFLKEILFGMEWGVVPLRSHPELQLNSGMHP